MMAERRLLATAIDHHRAGRLGDADALYRSILERAPDHIDALHLSGVIANQSGRPVDAIALIGRAARLSTARPVAEILNNLGTALRGAGRYEEAIAQFRRASTLKPSYAEAFSNLGATLLDSGAADAATAAFRRVLALRPESAKAHYGLGNALLAVGDAAEASRHYSDAVRLDRDFAEAHDNLGVALQRQQRMDEAAAAHRRALLLKPDLARAHFNLAAALHELLDPGGAMRHYARAAKLSDDAEAEWNEALMRLLLGDESGWAKYEARWRRAGAIRRHCAIPLWAGESLTGKAILVECEQGFGDTFQFIRYARLLKGRGARVIVECQRGAERIVSMADGVDAVVAQGDAIPPVDYQIPLLSLPAAIGTAVATVPSLVPYFHPSPEPRGRWSKLTSAAGALTVGLVWRGNPQNSDDVARSIPVQLAATLCDVANTRWFILQTDATVEERAALAKHGNIVDCGPSIGDWADTAALISTLDLVIAVDTGVAHLAGALGRPVWLLTRSPPDWRWLLDRPDSPWYPSMRIFRQPRRGDWDAVIAEVQGALQCAGRDIGA